MKKRRRKNRRGKGHGLGPHHLVSPMGHGTKTKNKQDKRRAQDRRRKQSGWV